MMTMAQPGQQGATLRKKASLTHAVGGPLHHRFLASFHARLPGHHSN